MKKIMFLLTLFTSVFIGSVAYAAPIITLTKVDPAANPVIINVNITDSEGTIDVKKYVQGVKSAAYFATAGNTLAGVSFNVTLVDTSSYYTVYAKDSVGKEATKLIYVDKKTPTITLASTITAPANSTNTTVNVRISDAGGIAVRKWASGIQNATYFASGGTTFAGTSFIVSANGDYTVFAKDRSGNTIVKSTTVSSISGTSAATGFVTCDINGNPTGTSFTKATIDFDSSTNNFNGSDTSGNYVYCGVDVGIFKKGASGWDPVLRTSDNKQQIIRNTTAPDKIQIDNFGTGYTAGGIYAIGYRELYVPFDGDSIGIVESAWKNVPGTYFIVNTKCILGTSHEQIINYYYQGQKEASVLGYDASNNPITDPQATGDELAALNNNKVFFNGDYLKYKLAFNLKSAPAGMTITLDFNKNAAANNTQQVEVILDKVYLSDTANPTITKTGMNKYTITINGSDLSAGWQAIYYKCRLKIGDASQTATGTYTITNTATITAGDNLSSDVKTFISKKGVKLQ